MSTAARFYFTSTTGRELADHELNGSTFDGCGQSIQVDGTYVHGYRTQIFVAKGRGRRTVTCADFDGQPVRVKLWAPNPDARETFLLVPEGFRP